LKPNEIASRFYDSSQAEAEILDVLASLSGLEYVETFDDGRSYVRAKPGEHGLLVSRHRDYDDRA